MRAFDWRRNSLLLVALVTGTAVFACPARVARGRRLGLLELDVVWLILG